MKELIAPDKRQSHLLSLIMIKIIGYSSLKILIYHAELHMTTYPKFTTFLETTAVTHVNSFKWYLGNDLDYQYIFS